MDSAPSPTRAAAPPIEREFKLLATSRLEVAAVDAALREIGAAPRAVGTRLQADTYLDDEIGSLQRAGIGLRRRVSGGTARLTCKMAARVGDGGLFTRPEIEAPWPSPALPTNAHELPDRLRDAVQPFTLGRTLVATQELTVQRDVRILGHDGRDDCELAIDDVEARAKGRTARFQEVELEVLGCADACGRLATELSRRLPLVPADQDKPTRAAARLGLEAPREREGAADDPAGAAVARRLQRLLDEMRHAEFAVRGGADPVQAVHAMRVAVRRMRGLVRACRALWPRPVSQSMLTHLAETGSRLGTVRDLDVLLEELPASIASLPAPLQAAAGSLQEWIAAQRDTARSALLDWLRSDARLAGAAQFERSIPCFEELAVDDAAGQVTTIVTLARACLDKAVARLRKQAGTIASELAIEPAHRLRIAAKRVRYLAEQFRDLPGCDPGRVLRHVVRLQQRLGRLCDDELAVAKLLGWIEPATHTATDGARIAAALGALATARQASSRDARRAARQALRRLDRKSVWKRLLASAPTA